MIEKKFLIFRCNSTTLSQVLKKKVPEGKLEPGTRSPLANCLRRLVEWAGRHRHRRARSKVKTHCKVQKQRQLLPRYCSSCCKLPLAGTLLATATAQYVLTWQQHPSSCLWPCLVHSENQKVLRFSVISNLVVHAWNIKYRRKQKLIIQFSCKSRDESFYPS